MNEASPSPWLFTVWHGGNNNAQANVVGRVLAVSPQQASFRHDVKVRRGGPTGIEAFWYCEKRKDWFPFLGNRFLTALAIPRALLAQAESQPVEARAA